MSLGGAVGSCSVAEVMGTEMFTVTPETAVASARRLVLENDVHHMLVLDKGTLAGIVCRDDLRFADRDARIEDCMTSPVLCITPDTTLQEAVDIMGANDIDCLPVVTGTFLVGIVTMEGLATANLSPTADENEDDANGADDYEMSAAAAKADESDDADDLQLANYLDGDLLIDLDGATSAHSRVASDGAADIRVSSAPCGACGAMAQNMTAIADTPLMLCGRCNRILTANRRC